MITRIILIALVSLIVAGCNIRISSPYYYKHQHYYYDNGYHQYPHFKHKHYRSHTGKHKYHRS